MFGLGNQSLSSLPAVPPKSPPWAGSFEFQWHAADESSANISPIYHRFTRHFIDSNGLNAGRRPRQEKGLVKFISTYLLWLPVASVANICQSECKERMCWQPQPHYLPTIKWFSGVKTRRIIFLNTCQVWCQIQFNLVATDPRRVAY